MVVDFVSHCVPLFTPFSPVTDLTLIPPPKTPDAENLIDFSCSDMNAPPPGFGDDQGDTVTMVMDLPIPIRQEIDRIVMNDEELGEQLAAIDALMLGKRLPEASEGLLMLAAAGWDCCRKS